MEHPSKSNSSHTQTYQIRFVHVATNVSSSRKNISECIHEQKSGTSHDRKDENERRQVIADVHLLLGSSRLALARLFGFFASRCCLGRLSHFFLSIAVEYYSVEECFGFSGYAATSNFVSFPCSVFIMQIWDLDFFPKFLLTVTF